MKDALVLIAVTLVAAALDLALCYWGSKSREFYENKWNDSYGKE
jgi:nitrogen fixation-related uncharacterized protein